MQAKARPDSLKRAVRSQLRRPSAALALLGLPGLALSAPTGEDVIRGSADVRRPDANNTIIDQHTERAVINWQTFNVDADEFVLFNQPGASSIVLNRVLGGDMSRILGQMQANGQVFLLNPHGVFFADGATLDVQGFLGSTLDMDPDAFMAGDYTLTRPAGAPSNSAVINNGNISAGPGGYVVLAGDFTENTGVITASAGTVALVSGNALTLDIEGDGLVSFTVDEATLAENAGVRNAGAIVADGGMVVMTAKVANELVATAVNNEGLVRAHSVEQRNGEIYLVGRGGDVVNTGTLDANGENANGGGIGIVSDRNITLADGGVQTATGDAGHKGGVIRAIAEEHLDYQQDNLIRVTGGTSGGFVEVSGHGSLALRGMPEIGAGGTFLIDPAEIRIQDGTGTPAFGSSASFSYTTLGTEYIKANLEAGQNVLLVASSLIEYTGSGGSINVAGGTADLSMAIGTIQGGTSCSYGACVGSPAPTVNPFLGGTIDLAGLDITTRGNISLNAQGGTINFSRLATTNGNIDALANSGSFGSINGGAGGLAATGNITLAASSYGGAISLAGAVNADGDVSITGNQVTTAGLRGRNVDVEMQSAFGSTTSLTINGNVVANDRATIGNFFGANGSVTVNGSIQAPRIWMNVYGGNLRTGDLDALGSLGTSGAGSFDRGTIHLNVEGDIETGALTAINDRLGADINLDTNGLGSITIHGGVKAIGADTTAFGMTTVYMNASNGGISIDGDLMASGYGGPGDGSLLPGVSVDLNTGGSGGINISGGVTVTGHPGSFSTGSSSGVTGAAIFYAWANGLGNLDIGGPVKVTGTGHAEADLYGRNVTTGNISVTAHPASITRSGFDSGAAVTENTTQAGTAHIIIDTGTVSGIGAIDVGDLSAKGPNAIVTLVDAATFNTGAITVNATGVDTSFTSSYGGDTFHEARQGGEAALFIGRDNGAASSVSIDINGGIDVAGAGRGIVSLHGNQVATRGIRVTAAGGEFSREGTRRAGGGQLVQCDGPCPVMSDWPYDGDFGGPRIDTGTVTGGAAEVFIGNASSYGGMVFADNVTIDGSLAVSAPGQAEVSIRGNDIAVTGTIDATATRATVNGSFTDSGSTSSGASSFVSGSVRSSIGRANVELQGADSAGHAVNVAGGISVSGPRANFHAGGGDVTLGNLSVAASGFTIDMSETAKDANGNVIGGFQFAGSHLVTGVGVEGAGNVRVGDVRVEGPGAAGIIFRGATVTTGNIDVRATAGEFTATAPSFNGGDTATVATGAAVIGFESPQIATVNGSVTIDGARSAHFGGNADISDDLTVRGGSAILNALPGYVDFLDHIDDGDAGEDPLELAPAAVRATNITAEVTNGDLALGSAQLRASGNMRFTAGGGMSLAGQSFNIGGNFEAIAGGRLNTSGASVEADTIRLEAGTDLSVSNVALRADAIALVAGRDISNSNPAGMIDAGALAILAGRDVDLSNTTLRVGDGSIASVPGDGRFLELLAVEGLAVPAGGPNLVIRARDVTLGGGRLAGDYVYVETNRLAIDGSFTRSGDDLLLQVAPLSVDGTFGLEQSSPGGGNAAFVYNGSLEAFDATTIALGSTGHTGNVRLSANTANVNIGDTNLFVLTNGSVEGLERVLSTGIVKDLATLLGGGFSTPQTDEIDFRQDPVQMLNDQYELGDDAGDDDEGDEEGEDTDTDTDIEEEDDSLIRRETSDEEMMCR